MLKRVVRYRQVHPVALQAVAYGLMDPGKIVTNTYRFDDIGRAMAESAANKAEIVKSVLVFD